MGLRRMEDDILQRFGFIENRSLQHVHIEVTVAIVIDQGHAGSHYFGRVKGAGSANEMLEIQSGFRGDILK